MSKRGGRYQIRRDAGDTKHIIQLTRRRQNDNTTTKKKEKRRKEKPQFIKLEKGRESN